VAASVIDNRIAARESWLQDVLPEVYELNPLAGDASFRRYFRVFSGGQRFVLMDAPPPHEDVRPFLAVRDWFEQVGLRVSKLIAKDIGQGFLLLEDFGDITWASYRALGENAGLLFEDALRQLQLLQASTPGLELPSFDIKRMSRECDLYLDWYLPEVAALELSDVDRKDFHESLADILTTLAELPRVPVHLDYHSRNLMLPNGSLPLGQIDYQDAVIGPVTYDLASLLYDCYQDYPEPERRFWSRCFYDELPHDLSAHFEGFEDWHQKVRLTALQRHIKAIGIFSRLAYRDGKKQFLDEIPLTRKHLIEEMEVLGICRSDFPLLYKEPAGKS
jgi:aminoglycoside/choline kinase family phosphotransferase